MELYALTSRMVIIFEPSCNLKCVRSRRVARVSEVVDGSALAFLEASGIEASECKHT